MIEHAATETRLTAKIRKDFAFLTPEAKDSVSRHLTFQYASIEYDQQHGLVRRQRLHKSFIVSDEGHIAMHAGMLPRLVQASERDGQPIEVRDLTSWPILNEARQRPNEELPNTPNDMRELHCLLVEHPRARLIVPGTKLIRSVVQEISRVFCDRQILVAAPNQKTIEALLRGLKREFGRRVLSTDEVDRSRSAIVVGSSGYLSSAAHKFPPDFDVFVVVGGSFALQLSVMESREMASGGPWYCIGLAEEQLSEWQQWRLEELYGPPWWMEDDKATADFGPINQASGRSRQQLGFWCPRFSSEERWAVGSVRRGDVTSDA